MSKTISDIALSVDQQVLISRPLADWLPILADDCQVYQIDNGGFLAKRFSQINFSFCDIKTATEILVDNLHALLRNKYFVILTDEALDRTIQIVNKMTTNLRAVLKTVTFNKRNLGENKSLFYIQEIPDACIAFRNGVYDFRKANWLFKYDKLQLSTGATLVEYDKNYFVRWYINYNFEPLDFSLTDISLEDFVQVLRELNDVQRNYCFELVYNMSHTSDHKFDINRFEHMCQILGYTCLNSFSQHFVMLIGAGQNGKNSLFDGCFTPHVIPKPSANDLDAIEQDRFITGTLEGHAHNIFLETCAKTYRESKNIKSLTGSPDQTIEHKNIAKYSGIVNCKFVFAGNDKQEVKFSDTTNGFLRRINMFEIFYTWDSKKEFLKNGDYYDASFSQDLRELKNDQLNTTIFVYLAMYGIKSATNNFENVFEFTHNEWNAEYADIDHDLKKVVEKIKCEHMLSWCRASKENMNVGKTAIFSASTRRNIIYSIVDENDVQIFGSFESLVNASKHIDELNEDVYCGSDYIEDIDELFISLPFLKNFLDISTSQSMFNRNLQKIYGTNCISRMGANVACIHCTFKKGKLQIIK